MIDKVFVVSDTDYEGPPLFIASTQHKAWEWVKLRQQDGILQHKRFGWTKKQLEVEVKYFEDPKELHPYTIDVYGIDDETY